ncbi:MAG TPA: S1/P1 nuclease [bacterium]|nr:S1/P1 nuclease [bacterium]
MNRIFLLACLCPAVPACAWGPVGHETVAIIAQDHLTPKALRAVRDLLGPGQSLASVANWADEIVDERPETAPWHHIDLPVRKDLTEADIPDYCPKGDCVVGQIERDLAVLGNPADPRPQKAEALKFLVHLVGDLHQPLHCANDDDRGGNQKHLSLHPDFSRHPHWMSLHAYWDHLLEEKTRDVPRALATRLEARVTPQDAVRWQRGSVEDWAFESYRIAQEDIDAAFPPGPMRPWDQVPVPRAYRDGAMRWLVDRQLEKAGLRLAWLLNRTFP